MSRAEIRLAARQREARALQLRQAGATYRQIGQHLGVCESRAYRIVQRAMDRLVREPADELRELELARLDRMWVEAYRVFAGRHVLVQAGRVVTDPATGQPLEDDAPVLQAIDRCLAIMARRARLLGLDAPTQATVTVLSEDAVDAEIRRLEAELRRPGADG